MYKLIVGRIVRQTFEAMSRGDYEAPLEKFAPDVHFQFAGDHAMAADVHDSASAREWFVRTWEMFDDIHFKPLELVISGFPWNTRVVTHFAITANMPKGRRYENRGMQLLRLRWGRVVEDLIIEDTQVVASALEYLASNGVESASLPPIGERRRPVAVTSG